VNSELLIEEVQRSEALGAARKASSASPIHHSPFTIHNPALYSCPDSCLLTSAGPAAAGQLKKRGQDLRKFQILNLELP
jgi:hypothetical protein